MASGEAATAATQTQTVVLRVSIHCHGCKKKVRKVLKSVEGVQNVLVDAGLHRVTVTGAVDADTLIKRLYKSGKQAVPWQPLPAGAAAKTPAPAPAEAQPVSDAAPAAAAAAPADKKPEQAEGASEKKADASEKKPEAEQAAEPKEEKPKEEAKPSGEAKKGAGGEGDVAPKQKDKGDEPAKEAVPAAAAKEATEDHKNSKAKDGDAEPVAAVERSLSAPPPKYAYEEAAYHHPYYPPQPVLSYHAAQPSASMSYYASQPQPHRSYSMQLPAPEPAHPQPMQQQWSPSYLYMPYPQQHGHPEPYYQDYYSPPGTHASPQQPAQDSYGRLFDDENPNSCSVM